MIPLFENVLIEIEKVTEAKTASGLFLPSEEGKKLEKATVRAKGKDTKNKHIKVGDTILLKSFTYDTVELDGKEYSFVKESDILAVV